MENAQDKKDKGNEDDNAGQNNPKVSVERDLRGKKAMSQAKPETPVKANLTIHHNACQE